MVETAQGALQPDPIPSMQYANDISLMTSYKGMWDIVRLGGESFFHNSLLHGGRCPVILGGITPFIQSSTNPTIHMTLISLLGCGLPRWVYSWFTSDLSSHRPAALT